jgi:DNA-binding transcriptional LysR family regulator
MLLPELFIDAEAAADPRMRLLRFTDPEPKREAGLVWRRSSRAGRISRRWEWWCGRAGQAFLEPDVLK